jgi:hypothetical protein
VPSGLAPVSHLGAPAHHHHHAVGGALSPVTADQTQSFQASGTFAFTGTHVGTVSGKATPLGAITGTFSNQDSGEGKLVGTTTFNFGSGALTLSYDVRLDHATNQFVGAYQITGGTGALADASGSGSITIGHGSTGSFALSGTISV